jgi:hypothetical protein
MDRKNSGIFGISVADASNMTFLMKKNTPPYQKLSKKCRGGGGRRTGWKSNLNASGDTIKLT